MKKIRTFEQAREFVLESGICGIYSDAKNRFPCLWDVVDLPDKQPGEKGWGKKVSAIWTWKNQLPTEFPDEIFYGKVPGGRAVLMTLEYLWTQHYPKHHVPIAICSPLARRLFEAIRLDVLGTTALRKQLGMTQAPEKNQFEKALVELQTTLNIARLNDPTVEGDTWVVFSEQHTIPAKLRKLDE